MIPGFLITWITFPGVIVHEFAHAIFCRLFGLPLYHVQYFQFSTRMGEPAGFVIHGRSKHAWQDLMVSIGPFFVNTIMGAVIAAPASIPILKFGGGDAFDYVLMWLGVSVAMHSFPSTGDAQSILHSIKDKEVPFFVKIIGFPLVGIIYLGALGSIFWLDALYGIAVAGFLPTVLVNMLS